MMRYKPLQGVIIVLDKIKESLSIVSIQNIHSKRFASQEQGAPSQDAVDVSPFAREMAEITAELKKTPDIREAIVSQINRQIADGGYDLKTSQVAGLLIRAGILKNED